MSEGPSRQKLTKEFNVEAGSLSRQPGMMVKRVAAAVGVRADDDDTGGGGQRSRAVKSGRSRRHNEVRAPENRIQLAYANALTRRDKDLLPVLGPVLDRFGHHHDAISHGRPSSRHHPHTRSC